MSAAKHAARRSALVACATALLLPAAALPATAVVDDGPPPEPEEGISEGDIRSSVRVFDIDAVRDFTTDDRVRSLGDGVESSGGQTTISLSADLLFAENSWDLPGSAPEEISSLVQDVPEGARVEVTGHTDSQQPVGQDFDNQQLSESRAHAVAEALEQERSDLDLEVSGVGESQPAVTEDQQDPATHAANRRVEIVFSE